ncbi:acid protease [Punctularia strigosozonata HHB-11173 SS5]|uniref:Acid protease n=1 Tax=Punctularia strigosozonata (strain HHB-11173) TaxID=741275 RepID=R7S087_PUNST|nr:acid protease [Punctularia strigosozonata HHB-11173 SS5]EIN03785.1 acid protease [Punctularia strigosozonata HHB-11173 SS5]
MTKNTLLYALMVASLAVGHVHAGPQMAQDSSLTTLAVRSRYRPGTRIVDADRSRIKALRDRGNRVSAQGSSKRAGVFSSDVTNVAVTYLASVGVGSPATQYNLLVDTGSSNTWVGADKKYKKTDSSDCRPGQFVEVTYGSGEFFGEECSDTVTLSPELVIRNQSIGAAFQARGFGDGIDGILGIGPVDLTEGTVTGQDTVPTVTDNLFSQGTISSNVVSVYFAPSVEEESTNGELTFGGVDTSKTTSDVAYVPITTTSPASAYWGIDETIKYGDVEILPTSAGIVDTGTTLLYLASDAYNRYVNATGATLDMTTGLLRITPAQYNSLKNLDFMIGSNTYSLTPNGQIFPRTMNAAIGGSDDYVYLAVNDIGTMSGSGMDFINGYVFLERFYSVYDTTNNQVGFATTAETDSTIN